MAETVIEDRTLDSPCAELTRNFRYSEDWNTNWIVMAWRSIVCLIPIPKTNNTPLTWLGSESLMDSGYLYVR